MRHFCQSQPLGFHREPLETAGRGGWHVVSASLSLEKDKNSSSLCTETLCCEAWMLRPDLLAHFHDRRDESAAAAQTRCAGS